jgi:phosphatidylserine/phosphatidylglycerophosphate/cardiolipin synthase-like enzyme
VLINLFETDLLIELANALVRIKNNNGEGVFILLSSSKWSKDGWEDKVPVWEIKRRLRIILKGSNLVPQNEVDSLMEKYLHFRRILKNKAGTYLHTKLICVDEKLMYVGSDNTYPCYNEEHGIWIEDEAAVQVWKEKFWLGAWSDKDEAADNDLNYVRLEQQETKGKDDKPEIEFFEVAASKEEMEALNKKA